MERERYVCLLHEEYHMHVCLLACLPTHPFLAMYDMCFCVIRRRARRPSVILAGSGLLLRYDGHALTSPQEPESPREGKTMDANMTGVIRLAACLALPCVVLCYLQLESNVLYSLGVL